MNSFAQGVDIRPMINESLSPWAMYDSGSSSFVIGFMTGWLTEKQHLLNVGIVLSKDITDEKVLRKAGIEQRRIPPILTRLET